MTMSNTTNCGFQVMRCHVKAKGKRKLCLNEGYTLYIVMMIM